MQQLFDFLPLIAFFVSYKMAGIFTATIVLMIATAIHSLAAWYFRGELTRTEWITLCAVAVFGFFTLLFHSETILKWKAPVVNWLLGCLFLGSQLLGKKPLIRHMMESMIRLPDPIWKRLNMAWGCFFLFVGTANLYVAFWHHAIWVDFKVFGSLGLMLVFAIGQSVYLSQHLPQDSTGEG